MTINKDQTKGRSKEVTGKMKVVAGKLVGNETPEAKGKVREVLGKAQPTYGDVKQEMKDAAKNDT